MALPPVDVLKVGICSRGHTIEREDQTIRHPNRPGRYCRQCSRDAANERAATARYRRQIEQDRIDMTAVEAVLSGLPDSQLRRGERRYVVAVLSGRGKSAEDIAALLRCSPRVIERMRVELRCEPGHG